MKELSHSYNKTLTIDEEVLKDIPDCYIYLDDILVFHDDEERHFQIVSQVFDRLAEYGLAINLPKCSFAVILIHSSISIW